MAAKTHELESSEYMLGGYSPWAWRLLGVLTVLLLARLLALSFNATDLFFDEAQYWTWSLSPEFGYFSKPPLVAWLIGASTNVCGVSEFCVRLPSPVLYTFTSLAVFWLGSRLYDPRTGFWSALAFATLPGVSLSAGIISTDVPLLFFWSLALVAFVHLVRPGSGWAPALALGVALGLGLNAKYAMAYFVLCSIVYFLVTPQHRGMLRDARWWVALGIAVLLIAPNLIWNYANQFSTFAHTADNAKWHGSLFQPVKMLEFFGSQFGVFGPILFAALLIITVRAYHGKVTSTDRLLLAFALPVLFIVLVQAFVSRAHANWAAVSYVSASVLVTSTMIRDGAWGWLRGSLALHIVWMISLAILAATAGTIRLPNGQDPFARTLGWHAVAKATQKQLETARSRSIPYGSVLTLDRAVTAELLYYMRDEPTPVLAWRSSDERPDDHYELTRPYIGGDGKPVLLVVVGGIPTYVADSFRSVEYVAVENIPAGAGPPRRITFARLTGFKD